MVYKNENEASLMSKVTKYLYEKKFDEVYNEYSINLLPSFFEKLILNRNFNDKSVGFEYSYENRNVDNFIGKIAFFPDMAIINKSVEDAFGVIVAARDTNTWAGNLYFVKRPHIKTLGAFMNTSPIIIHSVEATEYLNYFKTEAAQDVANKFLNSYCVYEDENSNKYRAYVKNFGYDNIGLELINSDGEVIKDIEIPIEKRNDVLSDLSEDVGTLSFSMSISSK